MVHINQRDFSVPKEFKRIEQCKPTLWKLQRKPIMIIIVQFQVFRVDPFFLNSFRFYIRINSFQEIYECFPVQFKSHFHHLFFIHKTHKSIRIHWVFRVERVMVVHCTTSSIIISRERLEGMFLLAKITTIWTKKTSFPFVCYLPSNPQGVRQRWHLSRSKWCKMPDSAPVQAD